ncbi:MAG: hypothetical protein QOI15_1599 [Pseudonocardiales bacterium]|nr:hypothetical protein [Pseudonocardiales bacterium]
MRTEPPIVLDGVGGFLAGPANVIMQLALAPVGYGVIESKVETGQVTRHPIKRFRTTFTYISVAMWGNEQDRARYREAVNGSHRLVRSDATSPVKYNAFDPQLQLWVAACLYYGTVDVAEKLHGPIAEEQADELYEYAARYGTTLQVPQDMWPADRAAFAKYWDEVVADITIDEPVREYLRMLTTRENMPLPLRGSTRFNQWITTGFLPPRFREQMGFGWTAADQARFDRIMRRIGAVQRRLPGVLRRFPFNWFLWDLRLRIRFDRRLV